MARLLLLLALTAACFPAVAGETHFQRHHPDVHHRQRGMDAYDEQRYADARAEFLEAARHADKGAQAMLAEMHWHGHGVPQDRALAYVWMDLAAERGYPMLVAKRERYWSQLTDAERQRALREGVALYADYGDTAAKPRLEKTLRAGTRYAAGTKVGANLGRVAVYDNVSRSSLGGSFDGVRRMDYYAPKFWQPRDYWETADLMWTQPLQGVVEVKPIEAER